MDKIKVFFENIEKSQIINTIIIIIVSIILYKIFTYILDKGEEKGGSKLFTSKKSKTYLKLIKNIIRYVFVAVTVLILLQINGIDVSSVLAGVGIAGAILGLAIQDWLKDVIRGSTILSDNYFSVGDIVKYKNIEGKVLVLGLKTTKIQDLKTGNIVSIANRNIEEIELISELVYINIPMPYETPVEKAEKTVQNIVIEASKNTDIIGCRYLGVNDLADSSIKYLIEVKCEPVNRLQVKRDTLKIVLNEMSKNGIDVPYTQIDVHNK